MKNNDSARGIADLNSAVRGHVGYCNNFIQFVQARTIYVKSLVLYKENADKNGDMKLGSAPNRRIVLLSKLFSSSVGELPKGPHFTYSLGPQSLSLCLPAS